MFMKIKSIKFFSFILAAVILVTVAMIIPTSAEDLPSLYVTQINQKVVYASGAIFTKAFNGTNTVKSSEGNFRWTKQIVCKPTSKAGVYELTQDPIGNLKNGTNGDPDESIVIPEGGFIYAAHIDDRDTAKQDGTFERSRDNQNKLAGLKKGDKVTLVGINIANSTIESNAVIYIGDTTASESSSQPASSSSQSVSSTSSVSSSTSSAPASSSKPASSSTSSKQPETGDNGILTVAVIAVLSLALASVISIRKRSR